MELVPDSRAFCTATIKQARCGGAVYHSPDWSLSHTAVHICARKEALDRLQLENPMGKDWIFVKRCRRCASSCWGHRVRLVWYIRQAHVGLLHLGLATAIFRDP